MTSQQLPHFWAFASGEEPCVPGQYFRLWPLDAKEILVKLGIIKQAEITAWVRCPVCGDHDEEVLFFEKPDGSPQFLIPCPNAIRVEVPLVNLEQWAINIRNLAANLAQNLKLSGTPQEVVATRMWRLGRWEHHGQVHDLLFVHDRGRHSQELQAALGQAQRPVMLFACGLPWEDWWRIDPLPSLNVAAITSWSQAGFVLDRQAVLQFVEDVDCTTTTTANAFRQSGDFWVLTFDGKTVHLKDSVGLAYIARLLSEPHRDIPAAFLLAARAGIDPLVAAGSSGEMLDPAARETYSTRYQELRCNLENAQRDHDQGRLTILQVEMEVLAAELARAAGLGGRSREKNDGERIRKSVSMAVARDCERIVKSHAALGRHLATCVSSGLIFQYAPEREITWQT